MQKAQAVASLGQHRLMLPAWVKAALSANDRLKVYLTVLQSASSHTSYPNREAPDLGKEIAAAGLNTAWLHAWLPSRDMSTTISTFRICPG